MVVRSRVGPNGCWDLRRPASKGLHAPARWWADPRCLGLSTIYHQRFMARQRVNFICTIPDCECKAVSRGFCIGHYNAWRLYGDPLRWRKRGPRKNSSVPKKAKLLPQSPDTPEVAAFRLALAFPEPAFVVRTVRCSQLPRASVPELPDPPHGEAPRWLGRD